jgi:hypothetical protein
MSDVKTVVDSSINGLTDTHPLYDVFIDIWLKNQDAVDGQEAIKGERCKVYLPKLLGMLLQPNGDSLYNIYIEYANWFNASGRTLDGLRGLVFRKQPVIEVPESMTPVLEDINLRNQTLEGFAKEAFEQVAIKNRVGILVDFPVNNNAETLTIADAEAKNLRPYACMYNAENIWNWREERINNKWQTSFVVLKEVEYEAGAEAGVEEFNSVQVDIIRVLDFTPEGHYRQRVYKKRNEATAIVNTTSVATQTIESSGTGYTLDEEIIPTIDGKPLAFIPFCPITGDGISWDLKLPAINDLVNVNIAHYRNSANYENGLLFTGNPTPCVSGLADDDSNDSTLALGSSTVLQFKLDGKWGFLEFSGNGLNTIREAMLDKENQMAVLGARILANDKKGVEAAETAQIHRAGENGVLGDMSNSIAMGLTKVLKVMAMWMGENPDDVYIELNTDYNPSGLTDRQIAALMSLWQQGRISAQDFFKLLKKGEIIHAEKTFEEHEEEIEMEGPALGMIGLDNEGDVEEEPKVEEEENEDENK